MKKVFAVLRDIIFVLFVLFICSMIFIMSTGKHVSIAGYQVLRVLTSSMEPAIAENTCIIIKECDPDRLKVGDIITFTSDDPQIRGYYNTHRIAEIVEENGEALFITKGDASAFVDAYPVHKDQVAGILVRELPGGRILGKAFLALSDNRVYFLVIMLPLTICLLSYFWQIIGFVTGRYEEDEETGNEDENEDGNDDENDDGNEDENEDGNDDGNEDRNEDENADGNEDENENSYGYVETDGKEPEKEIVEVRKESANDFGNGDKREEVNLNDGEDLVKETHILDNPEQQRIQGILEELVSTSVSEEEIEKKREQLKEEYKKILGNRNGNIRNN